jgi:hypothetical protein
MVSGSNGMYWVFAVAALLAAAPADLAERVRAALSQFVEKTPRYTCTETIERLERGAACGDCEQFDRIRVDVVVVDGHDLYALPGGSAMDPRELRQQFPTGLLVAGTFSGLLKGTLLKAASRDFAGEETRAGRRLLRFAYRVPVEAGAYRVSSGGQSVIAGYEGFFGVAPDTFEPVYVEARAIGLPDSIALRRVISRVEYARTPIAGGEFVLPAGDEMIATQASGAVSRIHTRYSGCRQYAAESSIRFGEPGLAEGSGGPRPEEALPGGLAFEAVLTAPVLFAAAAAGDRITARVTSPVKHDGAVVIPKESLLAGRISRVSMFRDRAGEERILGVRFTELELDDGRQSPFRGEIVSRLGRGHRLPGPAAGVELQFAFRGRPAEVVKGLKLECTLSE